MAEPPSDQPTDIDHEQLRKRAAPAFDDVSDAVRQATRRASSALSALGGWPAGEETDKAFAEWYAPKRNEMLQMIAELGEVYADIADGLVTIERNVATVEWGLADDMRIQDVPVYTWPDEKKAP